MKKRTFVYAVKEYVEYELDEVVSLHKSKEKAEEICKGMKNLNKYSEYYVQEYELFN